MTLPVIKKIIKRIDDVEKKFFDRIVIGVRKQSVCGL